MKPFQSHRSNRPRLDAPPTPAVPGSAWRLWGSRSLVLAFAALAAVATWIATRHGPGMSPDSVTYLSAARNLASGRGYNDFTGQALTTFPPGFPSLVAVGHVLGASLATGARIVNAVSFGATVVLAWVLIRRHVSSLVVALGTTAFVAISPALINISSNAWSEPLYCALVLGFILVLEDALVPGDRQARLIAAAAVLAGLAFLVRYAGLSLLVVGSVALVAGSYRVGARATARQLGQFWAVGLVLPGVWLVRNAGSGTRFLLGPRVSAPGSWGTFVGRFLHSTVDVFTPRGMTTVTVVVVGMLGLGGLAVAFTRKRRPGPIPIAHPVLVLVVYVSVYSLVVIGSGKAAGASIDPRIVTPAYVPAVILGAVLIDILIRSLARIERRMVIAPALVVFVALGTLLASTAASFAAQAWSDGTKARGYTEQSAGRFQLVRSVEALAPRVLIATNRPWTLFEATGRQPIVASPGVVAPELALTPILVSQLAAQACSRPVYLAWFTAAAPWPYTPTQLAAHLNLDPLQRLSDGVLYSVRPGGPDPDCPVASKHRPTRNRDVS